ncbi:hypothetical protein C8E03_10843 [Lachnotalea glycerini]|uniref:Uncharacterized protein n=1 Tax=Lachnotalea glycerini TaxID=1763509 RepID=A0A255PXL6_9FIRM|nr:hypothetical protein [Lachnotalea glycerini]OYP20992.1 hypothetical protein CG709_08145 [Lachnotalea glycerini]PXV88321.1 hypothetical protein C8E03_10843 [Lachnotalea glycerini]RDY26754.1 hypothetical protein CG710_021430 [Lachnotalea glycerini]
MIQALKKITCFILTVILITLVFSKHEMNKATASERTKHSTAIEIMKQESVMTVGFILQTPPNDSYLVGKDILAGKYIVFSDYTSSMGAFWEIENMTGNQVIDNQFTKNTAIITVSTGQRLILHHGYAMPMKTQSRKMSQLWKFRDITSSQFIWF